MTGIHPTNAENCLKACIELNGMINAKNIVIKLSDRGCFLYDGKYHEMLMSNNVHAVDTTAAGDAFTAALTIEYLKTKKLSHSCKYANVAGALAVTKFGAMSSLPTQAQIENFIAERDLKI
jgi:ribokinase